MEQDILHEKSQPKVLHRVIRFSIYLGILSMLLVAYWQFYPYRTFESSGEPFPVINEGNILKAGDMLIYHSSTCRYRKGEVTVQRVLTNDILVAFTPYTYVQDEIGCKEFDNYTVQLPTNLPNGKYHLSVSVTMRVNPIREITRTFVTEDFYVENPVLELNPDPIGQIKEGL